MADEKKDAAAKKPAAAKSAAKSTAKPAAKAASAKADSVKAVAPKAAATKAPAKAASAKADSVKAVAPKAAKSEAAVKPAKAAAPKAAATKAATADKAPAKAAAAKAAPAAEKAVADKAPAKAASAKAASAKAVAKKAAATGPKVNTLKLHHLRPAQGAHKAKIRVGRGEGGRRGKTAGRGTKGTGARYQVPLAFEGGQTPLHMRIPKLRGFRSPFKITYQVVNVDQIAELFPKGGKITKADLVDKGAVRRNQPVKVLGDGEISVKVTIVDVERVSQSAKTKIEAAGGSVNQG